MIMIRHLFARLRSLNWSRDSGAGAAVAWLVAEKSLLLVSAAFVGFWVVRSLGPEDFGRFSVALSLTTVFGSLATMGLDTVLLRRLALGRDPAARLLTGAILVRLAGCLVHVAVCWLSARWMFPSDKELASATLLLSCAAVFRAPESIGLWLQSVQRYRDAVVARVLVRLAGDAVRVTLILQAASMTAFAMAYLFESVVATLLFCLFGRGVWLAQQAWPGARLLRSLAGDGFPVMLSGLISALYARLDQVILFGTHGGPATGQYAAAVRVSELTNVLVTSIAAVAASRFGSLQALPADEFNAKASVYYRGMTGFGIVLALALSLFAPHIVLLVFGAAFDQAASVLRIHAWTVPLVFASAALEPWFYQHGKLAYYVPKTILSLGFAVPALLFATESFGPVGTAAAVVGTYFVSVFATNAVLPGLHGALRFQWTSMTFRRGHRS